MILSCLEKQIELCIIDTTNQKHFTEKSSIKFLNIITDLIELKTTPSGFAPGTSP